MARITVDEISRKEFSFANKGYNQKEVDDFLDDICDEIERMENEIMDLRQKTTAVRPAQEDTGISAENEESFREVLALAVQVKEEGAGRRRSHPRQGGDGSQRAAGRPERRTEVAGGGGGRAEEDSRGLPRPV